MHVQDSPSHSQVSLRVFRAESKPPYRMTRFRTRSYPIAGPPRGDGEIAGLSFSQLPSLRTHVVAVSEENVELDVAPPKTYRAFSSLFHVIPKWESVPGLGESSLCQVSSFHIQNSSETVLV